MVKHDDPEADRGKRELDEQQANVAIPEQPGKCYKRNRKRGPQKKLPKLRGLPPKLAHRRIPASLIEAGHEIVIKIVELGIHISAWRCFMLPQKNGSGEIHPLLDEVRKNQWASRDAPVVISNESDYANQNC